MYEPFYTRSKRTDDSGSSKQSTQKYFVQLKKIKMKVSKISLIHLITVLFLASSCSSDDDNGGLVITVDDAAELVAASMALSTYGAVSNMNYVSDEILEILECGESDSETRIDSETSNNGQVMVSFSISESYALSCEGSAEQISYSFNSDQTTTSSRLDTDHGIQGNWVIDGAEANSTVLIYNGGYLRNGEWIYNREENRTDTTSTSFVYSNVKANKEDGILFEGTSTFTITGDSNVFEPYAYEGNIVFQMDNICIATFSTGEQYEIDLNTGEVTPLQ